jgi:putative ABC transport system permease protein
VFHLLNDFRHGVRVLRRTPGFTVVAVLILALGIGANTAVFSVVNTLVLQPRPGRIDQLVGVFSRDRVKPDTYRDFSYPAYLDLRDRRDIFDSLAAIAFTTVGIRDGDVTKQTFASVVSSNYFATLGVPMAAGRSFTAEEERPGAKMPVAIASYAAWRNTGFSPAFVGSTVRMNARDCTIVGVTPKGFAGTMSMVSPQWWLPLGMFDSIVNEMFRNQPGGLADRRDYELLLAGALAPGVTRASAERALDPFAVHLGAEFPASDRDQVFVLAGLPRMAVSSRPQDDSGPHAVSGLLVAMAALVLIVACLNLANLMLARGAARRKEIAIRQALGSARRLIVQQLFVEGLTLAAAGAALGIFVGWWCTRALTASLGSTLPLGIEVVVEPSVRMAAAAVGFAVFSTVFFALGPAWALSRPAVAGDLKGEPGTVARRFAVGPALVIGQLAVSLALVATGGLFVRAAINASTADAGFSFDRQLTIGLDPSLAGYDEARTRAAYRAALDRVRSLPGVERVSFVSTVPFGEITEGRVVKASPERDGVQANFVVIGADYFSTLNMPIVRGREFTRAEEDPATGPKLAMIDVTLAHKLFPDIDPVGRQVQIAAHQGHPPQPFTIVGVAPAMRQDLFESSPEPHVFVAYGSAFNTIMTMHVRTAPGVPAGSMLATIRRELRDVDGQLPVLSARTMTTLRDASIGAWGVRAAATLFSAFGLLALTLATIGVYGLKAYDVSRRTREIGIRMALGATARDVARLVLAEGARTTAIGLGIGLLLAAAIGKLVSGFLYRVSPFDPASMVTAAALLAAAAMLACYLPARRATRVVPLDALRSE